MQLFYSIIIQLQWYKEPKQMHPNKVKNATFSTNEWSMICFFIQQIKHWIRYAKGQGQGHVCSVQVIYIWYKRCVCMFGHEIL